MGFFCRFLLPRSSEQFSQRHGEVGNWSNPALDRFPSEAHNCLWDCSLWKFSIELRVLVIRLISYAPWSRSDFRPASLQFQTGQLKVNAKMSSFSGKVAAKGKLLFKNRNINFFRKSPDSSGCGAVALLALIFDVMQRLSATILFQRAATLFRALQLSTERKTVCCGIDTLLLAMASKSCLSALTHEMLCKAATPIFLSW